MRIWMLVLLLLLPVHILAQQPVNAPTQVLIKPGDVLDIHLPGEAGFDEDFTVSLVGTINLPEIGAIKVSGLSQAQASELLKNELSQVFLAVSDFYVMIKERRLLVTVLGYVNKPGLVNLPQGGNIQMALSEAQGLKPGAQLDKIKLTRGEQDYAVDYKAYLDTGNLKLLPELKSKDIVFVPASPLIGNVQVEFDAATLVSGGDAGEKGDALTIFGELRNPGTFSFREGMSIVDALMRANGVTRYADVTRIRVINDGKPRLFDLKTYLDTGDNALLPELTPGATIFVPIQVEDIEAGLRTVYVMGEVHNPGAFEAQDQVTFLDLLANAGGPTRFAETRQIRILRDDGSAERFNLMTFSENRKAMPLPNIRPGDVIFIPEKVEANEKSWLRTPRDRAVKIIGAVKKPGRYEWDDSMTFLDLLGHAGGPDQGANTREIKVVKNDAAGSTLTFDLDDYLAANDPGAPLPRVQAGDTIIIEQLPHDPKDNKSQWIRQSAESSIYVLGAVGAPGRYAFDSAFHFLDILAAADGPNGDADLYNIRVTHRNDFQAKVSELNLALYFETGDETLLPRVYPGDTIYIPTKDKPWLSKKKETVVRLMGAIKTPGRYNFNESMTLLDLLAESGGPTEGALLSRIVVINTSCCAEQSRVFDFEAFFKNPDSTQIPVLRAGDTVYVPHSKDSDKAKTLGLARDVWSVVSVLLIIAAL